MLVQQNSEAEAEDEVTNNASASPVVPGTNDNAHSVTDEVSVCSHLGKWQREGEKFFIGQV